MRIGIIGGGIIGAATAHAVIDQGHHVTILDPRGFGEGASRGNAGWMAHMDVLPLASPKAWRNLPRWLADPIGPLTIRPAYLPTLAPWLIRFVAASRPAQIRASTEAITALHQLALPSWEDRLRELGLEHHLRRRGILSVWDDERSFRAAAPVLEFQAKRGIDVEALETGRLRSLEPALSKIVVAGALYGAGCHVADPYRLTLALGSLADERGARLLKAEAKYISPTQDGVAIQANEQTLSFDRVIIAAGAWSRPFAEQLGDRVPLDTERGYNATFAPGSLGLGRPVMFEGQGFVTTPLDTGDRVGGAVEFAGLDAPSNMARVDAILQRLRRFVPDARLEGGDRWMGFRPSIPDSLPVIGSSRRDPRVVYAFGHGHYGLTQAAITARLAAALVGGLAPPLDLRPFSAQRFAFLPKTRAIAVSETPT